LKNIAVFYYNVTGEAEKSLDDLQELIRLLDSNKLFRRERLSFYFSSLNNLILLQLHLGKYEEAKKTISLLESTAPETQSQRNTIFITRYNTRFDLYNYLRDFDAAYNLSLQLKKEIVEFEDKIDNRYTGHIRYAAFRSCFYSGHLKEALQWINQIVQKPDGEPFKSELVTIARISELMIHETLENYDLLERLTESAARFLSKTNSLYHFEKLMLDFFHEQVKVDPEKKALLNLQKALNELDKGILDERVFFYFDFRAWVEARIKGSEISAVLEKS
jgi:tetratricopeptide (TPR) repeat protein